jgi:CheY-like chemotaxis protein
MPIFRKILRFPSPLGHAMTRGSVLIVDDDVDIREILAETLVETGFDVTTACNGLDALTAVRYMKVRPAVILLDLMMPVMDGYEFLDHRSGDAVLASIPIAILTAGYGVDRDRLGHDIPILCKPFDIPELVGVLHTLSSRGTPRVDG